MSTSLLRMYAASLILALGILATACSQDEAPAPSSTPTSVPSTPTAPAKPTSTPRPTATPTAEPFVPGIWIEDQSLDDSGQVFIDKIRIEQPGWVVVLTDEDGQPGRILGFTTVDEGESQAVRVELDPLEAVPALLSVLYYDVGINDVFESSGPDGPVTFDNEIVQSSFTVSIDVTLPAITVLDQTTAEDGLIVVESVRSMSAGFIAIHNDDDGNPGRMLAYLPVVEGINEDIALAIDWRTATPILHAVLYEDLGQSNYFSPRDEDPPVTVSEEPVTASFLVQYPPDIFVVDQPVTGGRILVERALSYGPGWLVVYNDDEGSLGMIIGREFLEDGLNEQIVVEVSESAVTPLLYLLVHQDKDQVGQFEFPRTDPPVLVDERFPQPFTLHTDRGNYLVTRDQAFNNDGQINVPLVVVDADAWVVITADNEGEPGEITGRVWIAAGVHRDVSVQVDRERLTPNLHVLLHLDGGTPQEFEYPDGLDVPLQRNRRFIDSPMKIIEFDES